MYRILEGRPAEYEKEIESFPVTGKCSCVPMACSLLLGTAAGFTSYGEVEGSISKASISGQPVIDIIAPVNLPQRGLVFARWALDFEGKVVAFQQLTRGPWAVSQHDLARASDRLISYIAEIHGSGRSNEMCQNLTWGHVRLLTEHRGSAETHRQWNEKAQFKKTYN